MNFVLDKILYKVHFVKFQIYQDLIEKLTV